MMQGNLPRSGPKMPVSAYAGSERPVSLGLKIVLNGFLAVYLYQSASVFIEYRPGEHWPFLFWIIRNSIFLFIHEGGHGLFMFFGRILHSLGGSFWQIMFPFISFLIGVRKRSTVVAPFALFWTGINMMDVSLYMRDAPLMQLPLLGGHKSGHDWRFLFGEFGLLDSAGDIADVLYFGGLLISIGSIVAGLWFAVQRYLHPEPLAMHQQTDD
jgi:hypothetical protein